MTRAAVVVRDAVPDDLPVLMTMWHELRDLGGRLDRTMPTVSEDGVLDRLKTISDDPHSRALVAVVDDVGGRDGPAHDVPLRPALRPGRGPRALSARPRGLSPAGCRVMRCSRPPSRPPTRSGAEHIVTSVMPQLRDTQRFYARLGFGPVVYARSVPVSMLRRRLAGEARPSLADNVVARRRTLRRLRAAVARVSD